MQIYFTPDLHVDVQVGMSTTKQVAIWLEQTASPNDVLVLGGDYGNTQLAARQCLELFVKFPGDVCVILGNHDIWLSPSEALDTQQRIEAFSDLFDTLGYHWLEHEPYKRGDLAIVGSMGWYDYSFKDTALHMEEAVYRTKRLDNRGPCFYRDGDFVNWDLSDTEVVQRQCTKMRGHLDQLADDDVGYVFAALHHCPDEGLLRPRFVPAWAKRFVIPKRWRLLHAFAGSQRFSELLQRYPNVRHVACGHIHLSRKRRIGRHTFLACGSNYKQKEVLCVSPKKGTMKRKTFS